MDNPYLWLLVIAALTNLVRASNGDVRGSVALVMAATALIWFLGGA